MESPGSHLKDRGSFTVSSQNGGDVEGEKDRQTQRCGVSVSCSCNASRVQLDSGLSYPII